MKHSEMELLQTSEFLFKMFDNIYIFMLIINKKKQQYLSMDINLRLQKHPRDGENL